MGLERLARVELHVTQKALIPAQQPARQKGLGQIHGEFLY